MRPDGSAVAVSSLSTARAVRMPRTASIQLVGVRRVRRVICGCPDREPDCAREQQRVRSGHYPGASKLRSGRLCRGDADVGGWCALGHPVVRVGTERVRREASLSCASTSTFCCEIGRVFWRYARRARTWSTRSRCGEQHDRGHANGGDSVGHTWRGRGGEGAAHGEADRRHHLVQPLQHRHHGALRVQRDPFLDGRDGRDPGGAVADAADGGADAGKRERGRGGHAAVPECHQQRARGEQSRQPSMFHGREHGGADHHSDAPGRRASGRSPSHRRAVCASQTRPRSVSGPRSVSSRTRSRSSGAARPSGCAARRARCAGARRSRRRGRCRRGCHGRSR